MLKLTFLGRVANRWRIRVELPPGMRPRGLTVGLWNEDGRALAPSVVAPAGVTDVFEAELGGPCSLPAGAEVRCIADLDDGEPILVVLGLDRRRGLHAFLHADQRISVEPLPPGAAVSRSEMLRLSAAFPWLCPHPPAAPAERGAAASVLDMLKDDFDVDVEDMSDDLRDMMRKLPGRD